MITNNNIYWNSGIFLLDSTNLINLVYKHKPKLLTMIENFNNSHVNTHANNSGSIVIIEIDSEYSKCDNVSIDHGILELLESKQIFMCEYDVE